MKKVVVPSPLVVALQAAPHFQRSEADAKEIVEGQIGTISTHWAEVCDTATMQQTERAYFEGRQIFNPYAFEGFGVVPVL